MRHTKETERQLPLLSSTPEGKPQRRAHAVIYLMERSQFVELEEGQTTVLGRSSEADVIIDTSTVSRRHLSLLWKNDRLIIKDCGSTNGTFIDGKTLENEAQLSGGEEIRMGDALVVVGLTSPPPPRRVLETPREQRYRPPVAIDPVSQRLFSLLARVSKSDATVLLLGETGVGKDVSAFEIHRQSARVNGPFIHVNCGAIPSSIFAREIFGHEKGAFTGAIESSLGLIESASGGTLFLDEVAEIPISEQPRLLRVLEHRKVTPIGGTTEREIDFRLVAATNRDLEELVEQGLFREDLLYRLNVLTVFIPALRDRKMDIPALAARFLEELSLSANLRGRTQLPALSPDAITLLCHQGWPGNIRELRNVIERTVLLYNEPVISPEAFLEVLNGEAVPDVDFRSDVELRVIVADVERCAIQRALEKCGHNQSLAAKQLGISRRTLIYKMQRYDISSRQRNRQ